MLANTRRKISVVGIGVLWHLTTGMAWAQVHPVYLPPTTPENATDQTAPPEYPTASAPGVPVAPAPVEKALAPQTTLVGAAPAFRLKGPFVRLHADNPRARLQHLSLRWMDVCTAPCEQPVDPGGLYRVGGGTIKASPSFQLPRSSGAVDVHASVGSVIKYWVGVAIAANGLAALALGGLFVASADDSTNTLNATNRDSQHATGVTYLVLGAICMVVGLPLWLGNNTTVEVQ